MKATVIRIGNSRGVRIPKPLLEECHLKDVVDLTVRNGQLVIRAIAEPRSGWDEAFRGMAARGDDALLDEPSRQPSHWDRNEWKW